MPPPPGEADAFLQDYLLKLHKRTAEQEEIRRLQRETEKRNLEMGLVSLSSQSKSTQARHRPIDFYEQQIAAWFNRLPPEARQAPRTMEEFLNLLEGRTPGMRPHAGDVSRVLSRMGWVRRRVWKADGEGRRVWRPTTLV